MNSFILSLKQIWAIAIKEIRLDKRFILPFFSNVFFGPFKTSAWFFLVYFGFFSSGANNFGGVNKENYILFLLIGSLFYIFFTIATHNFPVKFLYEKYWQTIQGIIAAPINIYKFALGMTLAEIIKTSLAIFIVFVLAIFLFPIPIYRILLVAFVCLATFTSLMFLGLIRASYQLVNENINTILEYIFLAVGFISCFYYPIETFPVFFRPIIFYNPLYQAITLARHIWFNQHIGLPSISYFAIFVFASIILSSLIFNHNIKKYDLKGY